MAPRKKYETIETVTGNYKCEVLEFDEMFPFDKENIGVRPVEADYDRVIDNNTIVYLNGKRAIVFLREALTEVINIQPNSPEYDYWKWVSKDLYSDQRGLVGGRDFADPNMARVTNGQIAVFKAATKGKISTIEEAREIIAANPGMSRSSLYVKRTLDSGYVDKEEILRLESLARKKKTPADEKEAALTKRNELRGVWFDGWLEDWAKAEDQVAFAKKGQKDFVSIQTRANRVYSNILGFMDRSARNPFGRLTATTNKRYNEFVSFKNLYQQAADLYRDTMPEEWNYIHEVMKKCENDLYTLLGTNTFSTITINHNFATYYHLDGKNNPRGVAVLTNITNEKKRGEKYDGQYFVMAEFRLAFDIRHGDFFVGDNCNRVHGQTEMVMKSDDAESIILVFYARDGMAKLEEYHCEECRKNFIAHAKDNFGKKYLKSESGKFTGIFPGMWWSKEWEVYKADHCSDAKNTSYWYTEKPEVSEEEEKQEA